MKSETEAILEVFKDEIGSNKEKSMHRKMRLINFVPTFEVLKQK
jgi:hypothetical protein